MNVNNLAGDMINADFVAVKIGDVNGNASAINPRTAGTLAINAKNVTVAAGEMVTVEFTPEAANAYQFTLEHAGLELASINGKPANFASFNAMTTTSNLEGGAFALTFAEVCCIVG